VTTGTRQTDVVVAGAGPTGLMLACELRLAGIDVVVLDRADRRSGESRAGGMHPRTLEVLDQRGILDRFLAEGRPLQAGHFSGLPLDFSGFATRHPYSLMILQAEVERLLETRAAELGVRVEWSAEVAGISQDAAGVDVEIRGRAERLRARYLVGCDGGRSAVRKLVGIGFPGTDATMTSLLADVELAEPPDTALLGARCAGGDYSVIGFEPGWYRVITSRYDRVADRDAPVDVEQVRETMISLAGTDFGMHSPRWVSRFADAARQADRYRRGRVLLAGDAAHIHYPAGGQGQNLGIQDAVNLGWKLAAVVRDKAGDDLLDTYQVERYPVAQRVLRNTRAQIALSRPGAHTDALREVFGTLVGMSDVNSYLGGMVSALDLRYPLGDGHPLLGRRVPDVDLKAADGRTRMSELLHAARPVLVDLGRGLDPRVADGWTDRVDVVGAHCDDDRWDVPDVGEVDAPTALLVRPDGYVAWTTTATSTGTSTTTSTGTESTEAEFDGLRRALGTWFGPASR
jgi:2-polyprenyl-6-methoxyphenol hydroxylase-like FAD-dependent oxidoreductase